MEELCNRKERFVYWWKVILGVRIMAKGKPRWKDLPLYDRLAKRCKQYGVSDEMCEHIREIGKKKEEQNNK